MDNNCTYIKYNIGKCDFYKYSSFCDEYIYNENKCNLMDYEYYQGNTFICDKDNYDSGNCNQVQYIEHMEELNGMANEKRIIYNLTQVHVNLTDNSLEKLWCKIGDYDLPVYLSFLILLLFLL